MKQLLSVVATAARLLWLRAVLQDARGDTPLQRRLQATERRFQAIDDYIDTLTSSSTSSPYHGGEEGEGKSESKESQSSKPSSAAPDTSRIKLCLKNNVWRLILLLGIIRKRKARNLIRTFTSEFHLRGVGILAIKIRQSAIIIQRTVRSFLKIQIARKLVLLRRWDVLERRIVGVVSKDIIYEPPPVSPTKGAGHGGRGDDEVKSRIPRKVEVSPVKASGGSVGMDGC